MFSCVKSLVTFGTGVVFKYSMLDGVVTFGLPVMFVVAARVGGAGRKVKHTSDIKK